MKAPLREVSVRPRLILRVSLRAFSLRRPQFLWRYLKVAAKLCVLA